MSQPALVNVTIRKCDSETINEMTIMIKTMMPFTWSAYSPRYVKIVICLPSGENACLINKRIIEKPVIFVVKIEILRNRC